MVGPRIARPEELHSLEIFGNGGRERNSQANDSLIAGNDLSQPQYDFEQEFRKFAISSRKGSRNVWKLLLTFGQWGNETVPLFFTIALSLYEGAKGNTTHLDAFYTLDVLGSIVFHITCVFIRFAVEYANESTFRKISHRKFFLKCLASLLLLFKPIRYLHRFHFRYKKAMVLDEFLKGQRDLSKEDFKAVIDLNNKQLKDSEYEMTEIHIQALPMAILQLYIIFSNNQSFSVCSNADLARLWFFVACIYSAAKTTTDNANAYSESMRSFYFLYKFENPTHPMNLKPGCFCTGPLSFFRNALFTMHRFYCISFFLAVNPYLALVYIVAVLASQWMMLQVFPQQMRLPFENPPFGIHTVYSDLHQQWINLFSNYRTKLDWVSHRVFNFCGFKFQLFLSFLHIIPFATSMAVVFFAAMFLGENSVDKMTESFGGINHTGLVASCAVNETFLAYLPAWADGITKFVFEAHSNANHRFTSFKEVFGVVHFLPFSMYFFFVMTFTYSYFLNQFRLINPLFPVLQGYRMWHGMIFALLSNQSRGTQSRRRFMRRLMLLTQIADDSQFYWVYRNFLLERVFKCGGRFNQALTDVMTECVRKVTKSVEAMQDDLRFIKSQRGHPLNCDFVSMIDNLDNVDDMKIFIVFYADFDNRMRNMSSDRAKATFHMMGIKLDAYKYDFDCTF